MTKIFLRDDDVNILEPTLLEYWDIILESGACTDMTVEPANVVQETVDWLNNLKSTYPEQLSIITHGYDHIDRIPGMGEFGGRTYEDQIKDIKAGREIMDKQFGENFFPAFTCPRGGHNEATIRCMDETGYQVFSSYHNVYLKNKILYTVGRLLNKTFLMGKRVSHHMGSIPGTSMSDISMSMSLIKTYYNDDDCEFPTLDYLKERLDLIRGTGQDVIGVTVHHRFHKKSEDMQLIRDAIEMFKQEGCEFTTIETLYKKMAT